MCAWVIVRRDTVGAHGSFSAGYGCTAARRPERRTGAGTIPPAL
jgi:hypothetical protein